MVCACRRSGSVLVADGVAGLEQSAERLRRGQMADKAPSCVGCVVKL